ncbi:MAG TPA: hypothetical protein VME92_10990 [Acetobacteraceae bacterium]|nr:hypothetical protein [Acetobacteraceae bacterium]
MPGAVTETADIQALLRSGFGSLTEAEFLLLRIADRAAARAWLAAAPVTSVADLATRVPVATQIALTAEGMRALGVPEAALAGFADPFLSGMAGDAARSRRLGDTGTDAPESWDWGHAAGMPHVLLLLYAEPGQLARHRATVLPDAQRAGFEAPSSLGTTNMGGREPFGFADGISQPQPDWRGVRRPNTPADVEYGNLIAAGEFLLGYGNEYGRHAQRPVLDPALDAALLLPAAEDDPTRRDLGRNGSHLVFRQLAQDVAGFWRALDRVAAGDVARRIGIAEAMVGRRLSGDPLVESGAPVRGVAPRDQARNGFTYTRDALGLRCPIGAHVRRANPRTGDLPAAAPGALARLYAAFGFAARGPRDDLVAASRFHRLLRRGREYGTALAPAEALTAADTVESGLQFICLNADIARQFEFVQSAWLNGAKFAGLRDETDPLTGTRRPVPDLIADRFTWPRPNGLGERVGPLPRFVRVRGGAYFFLPGLRALRWIAGAG